MSSKYELTISTNYVRDWTYVQAIRELFQNAKDNEIQNPKNKMSFYYEPSVHKLTISNKTSVLTLDSLLLGSTSKQDDPNTIGSHGEGYKIAILVLLREGKTFTVYNRSMNQMWTTKLVKSRRFCGQMVPNITVDKISIFGNNKPDSLSIEVGNISEEEYREIIRSIIDVQLAEGTIEPSTIINTPVGDLLIDPTHAGKIFVEGLWVCDREDYKYGYNLRASHVKLDRDRRLISDFDLNWESSCIWKEVMNSTKVVPNRDNKLIELINESKPEVKYLTSSGYSNHVVDAIGIKLLDKFRSDNGLKAVPVTTDEESKKATAAGMTPIIVPELAKSLMLDYAKINSIQILPPVKIMDADTLAGQLTVALNELLNNIDSQYGGTDVLDAADNGQVERMRELIHQVSELENEVKELRKSTEDDNDLVPSTDSWDEIYK